MIVEYKYQIELKLNTGKEIIPIPIEQISGMIIDRSYDDSSMPIIIMQLALGKQLLDKIILNKVDASMILIVKKFAVKDNTFVEDYINEEFYYDTYSDINYTSNIEYRDQEAKDMDDVLKSVNIGMISLKSSNTNKQTFNNVYRNVSNRCMALIATENVGELVFEDTMNDYVYEELLVPPIATINDMLTYLNSRNTFYNSNFRYFMDFDRTYLLSSDGIGVETFDEPNNTVYINIIEPDKKGAYVQGMTIDYDKKAYIMSVDANYSKMYTNNTAEKNFNILHGITSSGKTKDVDVSINKSKISSNRKVNIRVPYENFGILENIRHSIESEAHALTIAKSNIDSSIITLNKHYIINNVDKYRSLNGDFILSKKVETYQRQGQYFVSECLMTFRSSKRLEE